MTTCNNTSVGAVVWREDTLLMIERKKIPFGFACPAGHIDEVDTSPEAATIRELKEEVGLNAKKTTLLFKGRKENPCRREGGSWHYWHIFEVETEGDVIPSEEETKQTKWLTRACIGELAKKTKMYQDGHINESEWEHDPGLEPTWYELFTELKILSA